jgi:AcrR family transcriptional regulator
MRMPAAERRRQLLDHARTIFAEHGFHDTSMNDVAESAGVTKPVLYQHFPSKRHLYLELIDDVGRRLIDQVVDASTAAADPRTQTKAGLAAYFDFVSGHRPEFSLLFGASAARDGEFARAGRRVYARMAEVIAGLLPGSIPADRRLLHAHGIIGMAEGTCRHWLATGVPGSADELAEEVASLLYGGLQGVARDRRR